MVSFTVVLVIELRNAGSCERHSCNSCFVYVLFGLPALRGIVVGNSFSERLRAAASEDTRARFYQAQASHAAGVLEGLAFIYPELLKESKTPAVSASS